VGSLDSPQTTRLVAANLRGLYASGRLLFMRDGLLFAQALDERTLQLTGEPVRVADGVGYYASAFGHASVDVSATGVLAFGPAVRPLKVIETFDRSGTVVMRSIEGPFVSARLSPDQRTLVVSSRDTAGNGGNAGNADIWTVDLARGSPTRITSDPETDWFPAWMPDGRHILFSTTRAPTRAGTNAVFRASVSGGSAEGPLDPQASVRGMPGDVSPDGQHLVFHSQTSHGYDILAASPVTGGAAVDYVSTNFDEVQPRFSPDGRWVAYASNESGRFEVYVRAWPTAESRVSVSVGGGTQPEWRRDGKELFYLSSDGRLMAVSLVSAGGVRTTDTPQPLFSVDVSAPASPYSNDYAVTRDGQRFIVLSNAKTQAVQTLSMIYNWTSALQQSPGRE
jgi:eukaryotic-like serine/threonine-protein kinase